MTSDYGRHLTARLAALGVSRNALGRALGHHGAGTVSRWAAGKVVPREETRAKIEEALAVAAELANWRLAAEGTYRATLASYPGGLIAQIIEPERPIC